LLQAALVEVLGSHIEQKGSLVNHERLRFDFSHFSKLADDELKSIENIVNERIRENIPVDIKNNVPIEEAIKSGATALFGEKYGDTVRVVTFNPDYSVELCGGTHVKASGELGLMKITSEGGIAAGIRRIEAVTGEKAINLIHEKFDALKEIRNVLKNQADVVLAVSNLVDQNNKMHKQLERLQKEKALNLSKDLVNSGEEINGVKVITAKIDADANQAKSIAHNLRASGDNIMVVIATVSTGKVNLLVALSDKLVEKGILKAGNIIKNIAPLIKGGGGGQAHLAMAGGKDESGIEAAFAAAKKFP
jgi:alanyl-tRNA synthetase